MLPSAAAAVLYAVVVGFNGSPSPDVPALRYADDDAAEYARLLREAGAHTTLLTHLDDDSRALQRDARVDGPPTRDALFGALARIDGEIARGGVPAELFIIYSGHGDVDHGEGFVMLDGSHLTRGDLYDRVLGGRRASRIHVVVDACKSYYLVYARGGTVMRTHHDASFVEGGAAARLAEVGFTLSTSSATDSHEWEEYGGGVFSHEVRSALRGAADADGDGRISYAELGAFVRQANAAIPNARFRPRFTVAAPTASPAGDRTPMLSWPALSTSGPPLRGGVASSRRVLLDVPDLGHVWVEDGLGRRLLDAHPPESARVSGGTSRGALHLPASSTLYVWSAGGEREYTIEAEGPAPPALMGAGNSATSTTTNAVTSPTTNAATHKAMTTATTATTAATTTASAAGGFSEVALSSLASHPRRVASRGALHEAFRHLFELPFNEGTVEAYRASPPPHASDEEPAVAGAWARQRPWKIAALTLAATTALGGVASSAAAAALRHGADGMPQDARVAANGEIGALNGAAIALYSAAGASAAAWAILMLWPSAKHPAARAASAPGPSLSAAPGPGQLGVSVAATW